MERYQSRILAKAYAWHEGIDHDEMFSPVARFEIVRILFSLVAKMSFPIYQFDVKSAFLNKYLE